MDFWTVLIPWNAVIASCCLVATYHIIRKLLAAGSLLVPTSSRNGKDEPCVFNNSSRPKEVSRTSSLDLTSIKSISDSFDWTSSEIKAHRPWHDGPHHVTMGLQKANIMDWVEIDKEYLSRYNYKRELFSKHPTDTLQYLPESKDAVFEALYYLVDFLPRRYPSMFRRTDDGIENLVTGDVWDLRKESDTWDRWHPLQIMGLLTTEDWFIMQTDADEETTRLTAGAPCFPAGWRIRERIGLSLWQIHAGKVPQYEEKLSKSMDRFFLRLTVDKPIQRFNYAIDLSSELFHINSHHNLMLDAQEEQITIDQLHLRVERQFLQRLPRTRAMIFSIRTYITPIIEVTKDKEIARALRTSVRSYSHEVAEYKNKHLWNHVMEEHFAHVIDGVACSGSELS